MGSTSIVMALNGTFKSSLSSADWETVLNGTVDNISTGDLAWLGYVRQRAYLRCVGVNDILVERISPRRDPLLPSIPTLVGWST